MSQSRIEGEYYFRKKEMVAGFNFSADGKFEFFFSYGAVDRSAAGTFIIEGDTLKLKSDKEPGKDFTVTEQTSQGSGYTITFDHPNKYLLDNIRCVFYINGEQREIFTDNKGIVIADIPHCDSIYVQHELFPDIFTLIKDKNNTNNTFKVTLNPSLEKVSFKGIDFKIVSDSMLTCFHNYFMPLEDIEFTKE